jgi:hypothetical protein
VYGRSPAKDRDNVLVVPQVDKNGFPLRFRAYSMFAGDDWRATAEVMRGVGIVALCAVALNYHGGPSTLCHGQISAMRKVSP